MSLFYNVLFLEALSSVLYNFGNHLMDLAFLIPFVTVSISTADAASVAAAALHESPLNRTIAFSHSLPSGHGENAMLSVIRPALLYQVLSYTLVLRDMWMYYMQWLISRGLACKVSMARMEVRYPQ
ncbi:hypothetical protein PoB_002461400 [Plakobranchus ocellatus]|uniref:Uncharacterized protein n=1 Tax=Plakobranchus ocellatus TaxID=259542 RepID=A0AAV3ZW29_9GAST|nr:hypothetical protein PoB_002461400 [Plakobranchus ocellatus]